MRTEREWTQAEWNAYWEERWRNAKELSKGRWEHILYALSPALHPALDKRSRGHVACPVHGGKDGYRMMPSFADDGRSFCNTCGNKRDGFATLMWANGWTARETLDEVMMMLTGDKRGGVLTPRMQKIEPAKVAQKDNTAMVNSLNRVMEGCVRLDHPSAELGRLYLARRGLKQPMTASLFFHPRLAYYDPKEQRTTGYHGAIVAPVFSGDGLPVTLHRTYLDEFGNKLNVESPKKMMAYPEDRKILGGAIRLAKPAAVFGAAEGIETALAAMEGTGIPVWATVNATLMEFMEIPEQVELLVVFSDKDRPSEQHPRGHGQEAAQKLVERAIAMGKQAIAITPRGEILQGEKSLDWLDVLRVHGPHGFPALHSIRRALLKVA
jgi:hypothetical protein